MENLDAITLRTYFEELLPQIGLKLNGEQIDKFVQFGGELYNYNQITNLTAIKDALGIAEKHFADSLVALPYIPQGAYMLDVGSGGGFPCIPFAIVRNDLEIISIDSVRKKTNFQTLAIESLGLTNIRAIHTRVQEIDQALGKKPAFDVVISRALANLENFYKLAKPWIKKGGLIITYKSSGVEAEIGALKAKYPKAKITQYAYSLPTAQNRAIVVIEN